MLEPLSDENEKRFLSKLSGFSLEELELLCQPYERLERLKEGKLEGFQKKIENVETILKIRKAFRNSLPIELFESQQELQEKENGFWNSMRKYVRDLKSGNPSFTPADFLKEWSRTFTELLGWLQPHDYTLYLVEYDPLTLALHVRPHYEIVPKEKLREVNFKAIEYHPWVLAYSAEELINALESETPEMIDLTKTVSSALEKMEEQKTIVSKSGVQKGKKQPTAYDAVKERLKLVKILKEHPNWVVTTTPISEFKGPISEVDLGRTPVYVVDLGKSLGINHELYHALSGVRVIGGREVVISTALNVPALHEKLGGDLYKFLKEKMIEKRKEWVQLQKALAKGENLPPLVSHVTQISPYIGGFSGALASKTFVLMPLEWDPNKAMLFAFYGRNPARNMLVEENRRKFDLALRKYREKKVSKPGRGLIFGEYFAALLAHKLYHVKSGKLA